MMASSPLLALTESNSMLFSSPPKDLANGIRYTRDSTAEGDDRSSSLSEIGDRVGNDDLGPSRPGIANGSDPDDTEAETERLEESPQKTRKTKNLVMTSTSHVFSNGASSLSNHVPPINGANPDFEVDKTDQLSEISSLADSGDDNGRILRSLSSSSRKRRRLSPEVKFPNGGQAGPKSGLQYSHIPSGSLDPPIAINDSSGAYAIDEQGPTATLPVNEGGCLSTQRLVSVKQKSKKGKRKGKKIKDEASPLSNTLGPEIETSLDMGGALEQESPHSNGEDVEMEDAGDDGEADSTSRNDEGSHIKGAMDSLVALEKCFLSLRKKIFDERLKQTELELAMLDEPIPTHPDVVAMMKVVNRRYEEKKQYAKTKLKYGLMSLQKKSIAEKAQTHGQFMQTARETRERSLEKLHKESYQLQRERRSADADIQIYSYHFSTRRSVQITNQTAYNAEVSILSGIAKYVGFPAAPELASLKSREIEEDLQVMGITAPHASPDLPNTPPQLIRSNSLAATAIRFPPQQPPQSQPPQQQQHQQQQQHHHHHHQQQQQQQQQKLAAEEQFLEQNPWANAQHPAHHHQHQNYHQIQRKASGLAETMLATPAAQRQIVDLAATQNSVSITTTESHHPGFPAKPATGETLMMGKVEEVRNIGGGGTLKIF